MWSPPSGPRQSASWSTRRIQPASGSTDPGSQTIADCDKKRYKARPMKIAARPQGAVGPPVGRRTKRAAHPFHLGAGVWWHDTADVDRFDAD